MGGALAIAASQYGKIDAAVGCYGLPQYDICPVSLQIRKLPACLTCDIQNPKRYRLLTACIALCAVTVAWLQLQDCLAQLNQALVTNPH